MKTGIIATLNIANRKTVTCKTECTVKSLHPTNIEKLKAETVQNLNNALISCLGINAGSFRPLNETCRSGAKVVTHIKGEITGDLVGCRYFLYH